MCKVNTSFNAHHLGDRGPSPGQTHWVPNTDVYVADETLVIKVELAGMRREDLELAIEGGRLIITGRRPDGGRAPGCKFLVMEINYGSFECVIEVPPEYTLGEARAAYQNGFLRVDVPRGVAPASKESLLASAEGK